MNRCIVLGVLLFVGVSDGATLAHAQSPLDEKSRPMGKQQFFHEQRQKFNEVDTDNNGSVSLQELSQETSNWLIAQRKPGFEEEFSEMDLNGNQFLSNLEIEKYFDDLVVEENKGFEAQIESQFEEIDKNQDGTVDKDEYVKHQMQNIPVINSSRLSKKQENLKELDIDGDGYISRREYVDQLEIGRKKSMENPMFNIMGQENAELKIDKNGDQLISRHEFEDYIKETFEVLDKNEDGELSVDEQDQRRMNFVQMAMGQWMGTIFRF